MNMNISPHPRSNRSNEILVSSNDPIIESRYLDCYSSVET